MSAFPAYLLVACVALLLCADVAGSSATSVPTAVGGGSSLAAPLWALAIAAYSLSASSAGSTLPALNASYASTSSGAGRTALLNGQYDYADSDSVPPASFWAAHPDTLVIPLLASAIVPIFNLPGVSELKLTQAALARIFMGNITYWSDEAMAAANPNVTLPNERITVIVRSDSSGTTRIYTSALAAFYQPFNTTVGSAEVVQWPIDAGHLLSASGNLGVLNAVESAHYSIGYSVLNDAVSRQVPFAAVQNAAGVFVTATTTSVQYALYERAVLVQGAKPTDLLPNPSGNTPSLVNPLAPRAYPISGFSFLYILANTTRANQTCAARQALVDFVLFFLFSDSMASLASSASFNTIPDLLRTAWQLESVITGSVRCADGTLAGGSKGGQTAAVLSLSGAELAGPVLDLAATSYSSIATSSISVVYTPTSTQSSLAALLSYTDSDDVQAVVTLSSQVGDAQVAALQQATTAITALPLALVPIVPVFNLGTNITTLTLSTELLGDIYAGAITYWNDTRIAHLNPTTVLPARPILLVEVNTADVPNPATNYEATSILVQTLFRDSPSFSACFAPLSSSNSSGLNSSWWSWSFAAQALPSCATFSATSWVYAVSETALAGVVLDQPDSLGFSLLASVGQTSIAHLSSPSGVLDVVANSTTLAACLAVDYTLSGSASVVEAALAGISVSTASPACWPFTATLSLLTLSSYSSLTAADLTEGVCSQAEQLEQFIGFLDQPPVMLTAESDGLLWLASTTAPQIVSERAAIIASMWTCNGVPLVPPVTQDGARLAVQQNPSLVTLAALLCLVGAWVALLLAEMTAASTAVTASSTPSVAANQRLVGAEKLRSWAHRVRDWVVALSRSQLSANGWLLLTAVALSVTSCWTTLVVHLASLSFECAACTADLSLHVDLALVLIGLLVAFFPTWAGLWLIHSNARRMSHARRLLRISPFSAAKPSSSSRNEADTQTVDKRASAAQVRLTSGTGDESLAMWIAALVRFVSVRFVLGSALVAISVGAVRLLLLQAVQTHVQLHPDAVAEACSAVLLWWPVASLSLLLCFHSARFRTSAAFLWTIGLVCYQQAALGSLTVLYDVNAVPFSSSLSTWSVSSTALVLMSSLLGAVSVLLFVWLQFSKLQLSSASLRQQCTSLLHKLGAAKLQHIADSDRYQRLLTVSSASDNALELINLLRPLPPIASVVSFGSPRPLSPSGLGSGDSADGGSSHSALLQALTERHNQRLHRSNQRGSLPDARAMSSSLQRAAEAWDDETRGSHRNLTFNTRHQRGGSTSNSHHQHSNSGSPQLRPDRDRDSPSPAPLVFPSERLNPNGPSNALLRAVLTHPAAAELLKDAAHAVHSCENVVFLLFMQRGYHAALDDVERQRWADLIVKEFIVNDAPQEINLFSSLASQINRAAADKHGGIAPGQAVQQLHLGLLAAEKEVIQLVNDNVWRQFRSTPQYALCTHLLQCNAQLLRGNEAEGPKVVSRASTTNTSVIE